MPEKFNFAEWIQLPQLYPISNASKKKIGHDEGWFTTTWTVTNSSDLWKTVQCVHNRFKAAELEFPHTLWFRGHTKKEYVLLPSLIRSYFDKKRECSLPQYQKILLEKFMARSKGASELIDDNRIKRDNEQIEYVADMQHYRVPTNLMDWTEDISIALFFATEGDSIENAAVYILHPYFYNFVRNAIISMYQANPLIEGDEYNHATAKASIGGLLPNFSAHFNLAAQQYVNYITGPEIFPTLRQRGKWRTVDPLASRNTHAPLLPLAIQIPRSNPRIRSQSGTFLAFNLCEFPLVDELRGNQRCHGFDHVELEHVQQFYMSSKDLEGYIQGMPGVGYQAMRSKLPFLHKILIDMTAVDDIRNLVTMLGKRTDTVYPELYQIGEQIEGETQDV